MTSEQGLAKREQPAELGITQASLTATGKQLQLLEQFVKEVLKKDEDYGIIPGTHKPTLLKPGAANVTSAFNCHAEPHIEQETIELERGYIFYRARVDIISNLNGALRASGYGSCSSYEVKYRYRDQKRKCPTCSKETIIKGRQEYGGGWLCFAKMGGCGAKFKDGDQIIEGQVIGKIVVEDPMEQANTLLKMAVKRAEVDASMRLPGVARFFTQDIGDSDPPSDDESGGHPQTPALAPTPKPHPTIAKGQERPQTPTQTPSQAPAGQGGGTPPQAEAPTVTPPAGTSDPKAPFGGHDFEAEAARVKISGEELYRMFGNMAPSRWVVAEKGRTWAMAWELVVIERRKQAQEVKS